MQFENLPPAEKGMLAIKPEMKDEESIHHKPSFVEFIVTVEESG
jgi:hypothetical protein